MLCLTLARELIHAVPASANRSGTDIWVTAKSS